MDSSRAGRPSQVRPRPPSGSRPAPVRTRPVAPSPTRLSRHRQIDRRRDLPLVAKAFLAFAIVVLAASIAWIGSGGIGPVISGIAGSFGGMVDRIGDAVASHSPTPPPLASDVPSITPPEAPYTSDELLDVTVTVPTAVVGQDGYSVRLWATPKDAPRTMVAEVAVGPTSVLVIPGITLTAGRNDLQASIVGPGGESELSAVATWVLDTVPPKVTIISPKDGAPVAKNSVKIRGKTQARSTVLVRNDRNGATASTEADPDGLFEVTVAVGTGPNPITVTATDLAGNANSKVVTVVKGSGKLLVKLTGTAYRFKASKLPRNVTFTVLVTGPDGKPVKGATALFTVTIPGLEAIVSGEMRTRADGTASFGTRIPRGALAGSGLASVLVTTDDYGAGTDRQALTVE
jgi:hypothetical protein